MFFWANKAAKNFFAVIFFIGFFSLTVLGSKFASCVCVHDQDDAAVIHQLNQSLEQAIIYDGFSPPVASRIYAYCNLTAYEAVRIGDKNVPSLVNKLNGFQKIDDEAYKRPVDRRLLVVRAYSTIARALVYHKYFLDSTQSRLENEIKVQISGSVFYSSIEAANDLSKIIINRMNNDNYAKTRDMPQFDPVISDSTWQPTWPTYGDAIEPYWATIKPFFLDSASEFKMQPTFFSKDTQSDYYKSAVEVYQAVKNCDKNQKDNSIFWDCNPQKTNIKGHLMYKTRQLTPGGHWIDIARYALLTQKVNDLESSTKIYALVSIVIADAFINCWYIKFKTNCIRPETYIQRYIDSDWTPLLETPLFPEYPSGHSEISAAASSTLERYFGTNFDFIDSSEIPFVNKSKTFHSFDEAANEAILSRFYGGIHYMHSCLDGKILGRKISEKAYKKIGL